MFRSISEYKGLMEKQPNVVGFEERREQHCIRDVLDSAKQKGGLRERAQSLQEAGGGGKGLKAGT